MPMITEPSRRTATAPMELHAGPVTLINSFSVLEGREAAFLALWNEASGYFRAQPGFLSLTFHKALSPDTAFAFVNVAVWASAGQFAAAHQTEAFRHIIGRPAWREFPSRPALYQVAVSFQAA